MINEISSDAKKVLRLLRDRHNVLISGAPGTGKSRLLGEVVEAFGSPFAIVEEAPQPVHVPGAAIPIPNQVPANVSQELQDVLPAPARTNREVFRTTFHQNSKYREFLTGLVPIINGGNGFRVMPGTLYRASEHGKSEGGAALLVIDEINRGPAVQVFGGSIVAIEPDKRLAEDNSVLTETQFFEVIDPESGEMVEYALPEHLYILAAMNQADTSVEPLDVAFLRRWAPYHLGPSDEVLRAYFQLEQGWLVDLPSAPENAAHVYEAVLRAWHEINNRIRIGRGVEFQIGHGVFMAGQQSPPTDLQEALVIVAEVWGYISAHVEEVFFGDLRGVAAVLNVIGGPVGHPYKLNETVFADEPRVDLIGPDEINAENVYELLIAIVG